jgi:DNA-binding response OmpR family regulator
LNSELSKRILVVHNSRAPQETLVTLLRQNQFEVFEAHSTHDAMEILDREALLILIVESDLAGMDGFELLREVKSSRGIVQVIMIGDNLYLETLMRALDEGADDYLLKPLDAEAIRPVLSAAVQKIIRWQKLMGKIYANREEAVHAD